ncbi:MAG: DegT/DnrJ/EryC1/StrS family aminotransferase [Leptospiraceae bacterium]|nr:DegT/DnrJ/EryC1/StrS family aminotransferase [Leptospiraceae bacterium]
MKFHKRKTRLPFALPDVGEREIQAGAKVLRSGWLTSGPEVQAFEKEFARATDAVDAVAVNSCTAALHLALEAYNIKAGDAVFVPDYTFIASAEIVLYGGALPVIVDVDRDSYLLTAEQLEACIAARCLWKNGQLVHKASGNIIRAIIPVHYGGRPCEMNAILRLARKYRLKVIEDAAHSFPAEYDGQKIGSIGDLTAFSFYATKNLTTGEGGMLTFTANSAALADRVRRLRLHGILGQTYGRQRWQYDVVDQGYKYNMMDSTAAMGRVQLKRSQQMLKRRRKIHQAYNKAFGDLPVRLNPSCKHSSAHHLYTIEIRKDAPLSRDEFVEEMYARNIAVSLHFIPIHRLKHYRKLLGLHERDFQAAEDIFQRIVSLPIYSAMSDNDTQDVIAATRNILAPD